MGNRRKYTKEFLEPIVKQSVHYSDLLKQLGLKNSGGMHRLITTRIKEYNIDTSHFLKEVWNKGKSSKTDDRINRQRLKGRTSNKDVFCKNSGYNSSRLYKRLLELKWKNECSKCKITQWNGIFLRFHVDHINGDHSDNRIKNLRFLCPNCHQQTKTWGYKNKH